MSYDLGTAHGTIELEYNGRREARQAERDMERIERQANDTDGEVRRLGEGFRTFLGGLGRTGGMAALGGSFVSAAAGAANLAIQVAGIVPQLASLVSLSAALPGLYAGMAVSAGVLKASFAGMSDVMEAAFDPKKAAQFNEALKELSPNARDFALAVKEAVEPLKEVQQGIQDAFFSNNLERFVPQLVSGLQQLSPELEGLAADFGRFAGEVVRVGLEADSLEFLSNVIITVRDNVSKLEAAIEPVISGLRNVGFVGLPLMDRLGNAVLDVGVRFGDWLTEISNDGRLEGWIETAMTTLRTLGGLVSNVGVIFREIFQAAGDTSGGLLNTLEKITGEFAAFLSSAEGGEAIRVLFRGIAEVAANLAPIITTIAGALGKALGPALQRIGSELGPVLLKVVQELAPALGPLANAIADLFVAVAPLLPPIARLVAILAQLASGLVSGLVAQYGPLVEMLGGALFEALGRLMPVFEQFATEILPIAAQTGAQLLAAFAPLAPIIVEFAEVLANALLDNMPEILSIIQEILPLIGDFAEALSGGLGTALEAIIPMIPAFVDATVLLLRAFWQLEGFIIRLGTAFLDFVTFLASIPGRIGGAITSIRDTFVNIFGAVVTFVGEAIGRVVDFFTALPGRITGAISALPGRLWNFITGMLERAAYLFGQGVGIIIGIAATFPARSLAAIRALPGQLWNLITSAWNTARSLFTAGVNGAVNIARTLPSRARSAANSLIANLRSLATNAWNGLRSAFSNGVNNAVNLARSLPGRVISAVGNLAGRMYSAGSNAVAGLVNGIRSGIGAIGRAARDIGNSFVSGIKSVLKISSPSKVMIEVGAFTAQGFQKGIEGELGKVHDIIDDMIGRVGKIAGPVKVSIPRVIGRPAPLYSTQPMPRIIPVAQGQQSGSYVYPIQVGGKNLATLVVDALTGVPVTVNKLAAEGSRRSAWAGNGRTSLA